MNPGQTLILLIWALGGIIAATLVGRRKGRPWTGFVLGLLLGWIGVAVIAVTPPTYAMRVQRERERLRIQREAQES
jgi:hypothetical protein